MGECKKQMLQGPFSIPVHNEKARRDHWVVMEGDDNDAYNPISSTSSLDNSTTSNGSVSSSDLVDDASSSSTSYSSSSHSGGRGPLYELSELMAQLPIKRGLSKYYQGKSQSFASLSSVKSIEDLAKKETPYRRKMKTCKSYGGGLDSHKLYTLPKATISKKVSRSTFSSLSNPRRSSFIGSCKPPQIPSQNNLRC